MTLDPKTPDAKTDESVSTRREIAKKVAYLAPAALAVISIQARAVPVGASGLITIPPIKQP